MCVSGNMAYPSTIYGCLFKFENYTEWSFFKKADLDSYTCLSDKTPINLPNPQIDILSLG